MIGIDRKRLKHLKTTQKLNSSLKSFQYSYLIFTVIWERNFPFSIISINWSQNELFKAFSNISFFILFPSLFIMHAK